MMRRLAGKALSLGDRMLLPASEAWWGRGPLLQPSELGVSACVVLAPHPDDETLGCGATIAGLAGSGVDVAVIVATDGRAGGVGVDREQLGRVRLEELMEATAELGLTADRVRSWGLEDGTLSRQSDKLRALIRQSLEELTVDTVFVTCRIDPHPDHSALAAAAFDVFSRRGGQILEYPVWSRLRPARALLSTAAPRYFTSRAHEVVRVGAAGSLERKTAALESYRSQLRNGAADRLNASGGVIDDSFYAMFLRGEECFARTRL